MASKKAGKSAVAVVMGSDSDLGIMQTCIDTLKDFGIQPVVRIISAHRTPKVAARFAQSAAKNGIKVIIAAAGMAAHLAGAIAAQTTLPVIGVPLAAKEGLAGLDALLSTVQMPSGSSRGDGCHRQGGCKERGHFGGANPCVIGQVTGGQNGPAQGGTVERGCSERFSH